MSSFTRPLVVSPQPDGRNWVLVEPFEFWFTDEDGEQQTILVPAGFTTDFASTPRLLWWLLPPWGRYGKAAVVHDYCYRHACFPRKVCDKMFLEAMKVLKVPSWKRYVMYAAVRAFGAFAYRG